VSQAVRQQAYRLSEMRGPARWAARFPSQTARTVTELSQFYGFSLDAGCGRVYFEAVPGVW